MEGKHKHLAIHSGFGKANSLKNPCSRLLDCEAALIRCWLATHSIFHKKQCAALRTQRAWMMEPPQVYLSFLTLICNITWYGNSPRDASAPLMTLCPATLIGNTPHSPGQTHTEIIHLLGLYIRFCECLLLIECVKKEAAVTIIIMLRIMIIVI